MGDTRDRAGSRPAARRATRAPSGSRVEYTVVYHRLLDEMIEQVNRQCLDGWIPSGAMTFDPGDEVRMPQYFQAMVRHG